MQSITLVFPHQLFRDHPAIASNRQVFLVEENLFFNQYSFHKQKLVLHRATMKMFESMLRRRKIKLAYIEAADEKSDIRNLIPWLAAQGVKEVHYTDVVDNWLEKRIRQSCADCGIERMVYTTPNFFNRLDDVHAFFDKKKRYLQTEFYIWQRKQLGILLDNNHPKGGKWTYDAENRLKFPKNELPPDIALPAENAFVREARKYVSSKFSDNYGALAAHQEAAPAVPKRSSSRSGAGFYPTTYDEAEEWLEAFLSKRFQHFGIYQDAIVGKSHYLHHSVLTPMLNIGLLDPRQIVNKAVQAVARYDVPLNSLEGFIRQIIGWREFIRIVYEREGSRQRTRNFWGFTRKIPASFWTGETGIPPVDTVIHKLLHTGYAHHIERLMVLANFMLLCEFDPDEVYRWFMEMFVDSYDWVMVPNVYGMTQFADGGLMATKPYISSSNYIMKMSDHKKGPWQEIWDGLFWRFMHVNRSFFLQNSRLNLLLASFDKMPEEKKQKHLGNAEKFLQALDSGNVHPQNRLF